MFCCALFRIPYDVTLAIATATRKIEAVAAGGCSILAVAAADAQAVAVAAADKLSGATLPPSGNTLPLRGLKMAVAEAVAAAVSLSATVPTRITIQGSISNTACSCRLHYIY